MAEVFARLDYTFVSPDMLTHVLDSSIGVAYHSPLFLQFSLQENDSGKGIWRVPTYILGDPTYRELINQTIREIEGHNPDANPALLWETIKACIHGDTIRFLARQKIAKKCKIEELEMEIFHAVQDRDQNVEHRDLSKHYSAKVSFLQVELEDVYQAQNATT